MNTLWRLFTISLICILISCSAGNESSENTRDDVNLQKISETNAINQAISNQAKESLRKRDSITVINAVNTDDKLIIAFEIEHNKRFQLADFRQKVQKKMKKEFPEHTVKVSTDKKLVLEINQLEKKITKEQISKKKLKKEVKRLIKLMKDKT